jgi:hypothetical protein
LLLEVFKPTRTVVHNEVKFSEQYALWCGLSKNDRIGIQVTYFHRYYESNKDSQLADKADALFATVIIVDENCVFIAKPIHSPDVANKVAQHKLQPA